MGPSPPNNFLRLSEERTVTSKAPCGSTLPCCGTNCCIDCRCGCRVTSTRSVMVSDYDGGSHHSGRPVDRPLESISSLAHSYASLNISDIDPESVPYRHDFVAPSLFVLNNSPAHRTDDQMAQERAQDFWNNMNDDFRLRRIRLASESGNMDFDQLDIFGATDLSDSMHVGGREQSLLSSYSSSFNQTTSSNSLIVHAGAGASEMNHQNDRTTICQHMLPVRNCRHCRQSGD